MYYICNLSGAWFVSDGNTPLGEKLPPATVEAIRQLFPSALNEGVVLDALMLTPISASKLQQPPPSAYFFCRFGTTWSLYDGYTRASKALGEGEVDIIRKLFPGACNAGYVLDAIMVSPISASKLQSLKLTIPAHTFKNAA